MLCSTTFAPRWYHPLQSCCPNTTLYAYHHPAAPPSPSALRPTLAPFPSLPLSPSLHPQPAPSLPHLFSGPPQAPLPPQNIFCSWLRVLHMGLGVGLGRPAGLEDTLPFIRGPTEWAYSSNLRKPSCFLYQRKCAEASLEPSWRDVTLRESLPSLQTPQSRPSLPGSFCWDEREWNLTNKMKRAGENTRNGPTFLPTKA